MTTTDTPDLAELSKHRQLTQAQLGEEARERFGENPLDWAFICPRCGDIATARDFPKEMRERVGQECIGRHVEGRGCKTVAYGFFKGPWAVAMLDGTVGYLFALAPAPSQAPQGGAQPLDGTPGPENATDAPDAAVGPGCGLSVERGPGSPHGLSGERSLDLTNWDYRVALTDGQSALGYRDARPDEAVTVLFVDAESGPTDWCHALAPDMGAAKEHIEQYRLPITEQQLVHALLLIVEACAEDTAAAKSAPLPSEPYLTGDDHAESES